jgi:hypothetical protein
VPPPNPPTTTRDQPPIGTASSSGSRPIPAADRKRRREEENGVCAQLEEAARDTLTYPAGGWLAFKALQGRRGSRGWVRAVPAAQRAAFAALPPSPADFAAIFQPAIVGDIALYGSSMAAAIRDMAVQVCCPPPS